MKRFRRTHLETRYTVSSDATERDHELVTYAVAAYSFLVKPGDAVDTEEFVSLIRGYYAEHPRHEAIIAALRRTAVPALPY